MPPVSWSNVAGQMMCFQCEQTNAGRGCTTTGATKVVRVGWLVGWFLFDSGRFNGSNNLALANVPLKPCGFIMFYPRPRGQLCQKRREVTTVLPSLGPSRSMQEESWHSRIARPSGGLNL